MCVEERLEYVFGGEVRIQLCVWGEVRIYV